MHSDQPPKGISPDKVVAPPAGDAGQTAAGRFAGYRDLLYNGLTGPHMLAFLPALMLAGYWFGGETALLVAAVSLPALVAVSGWLPRPGRTAEGRDPLTSLAQRPDIEAALDAALAGERSTGRRSACLVLSLDEFDMFETQHGPVVAETILRRIAQRLRSSLRDGDVVARIDGATFGIALTPVRRMDLETLIQMSVRLQEAISDPILLDAGRIYLTASIGFCLPARTPARNGAAFVAAAEQALAAARANGPGSIRSYAGEAPARVDHAPAYLDEVSLALEQGQIRPWFQPQISTDTGDITGFEALARWQHPERGLVPPGDFLPAIAAAGLNERLGEVILYNALTALRAWDRAGLKIPRVAVNFSGEELSDPRLVERVRWELDRFELTPDRLAVEVLETVISKSENDTITRNIAALGKMGCLIELDDFGTGNASLAAIRRFAVNRIKIDRSYITRVDRDRDQQEMVSAILTMAERLRLETLAEGVESVGEHAMLAQLGCQNVQGFAVGRPMPFEETIAWIVRHREKLSEPPQIGREAG
ncbi:MAG: bifunctional diguanylate cyclase/phosphodiesterase [Rhodobacteraceae bacterium]|jgi:diguanylate cyclase (GGDEF)-like protein|nr:bifunctional diguanylate cyclase/phosphodiesterase [Paracoccaceae bacterium]